MVRSGLGSRSIERSVLAPSGRQIGTRFGRREAHRHRRRAKRRGPDPSGQAFALAADDLVRSRPAPRQGQDGGEECREPETHGHPRFTRCPDSFWHLSPPWPQLKQ